ncbi:hypothetical protein AAG570_007076 [Ranatra chinensis]|uniref:Peptidase S1 domain-containing protein n=1 Tax=Ranatra chinensis TaxID=642074 RepID=A0ABD0XXI7_9HEMI
MVGVVSSRLGRLACGGALIGARHALTAAHCLRDLTPSEVALLLADHDTSTGKETNATRMEPVIELLLHPQFDPAKIQNDLAIVKTAKRVDFNQRLGPVCLPFTHPETFVGQKVTALGWGTTEFGGETPDKLRKVKLDVVPVEECVRVYGQNKITRDKQICTYSNGKDACQFDSGGPVVWLDSRSGRWMLAGIISYGRGCAENGIPSVNVRTYSYLDWIVANTAGK